MTDPTPTPPAVPAAPVTGTPDPAATDGDGKGGKSAVLADLATERDKRQALEAQVQQLTAAQTAQTDALAKAFGIKSEETSDTAALAAKVTTLQEQFATAQHQNAVLSTAAAHGITDKDDVALLSSVKDEATMQALAARIAKGNGTPGTPKPDRSQGGTGSDGQNSGSPSADFSNFLSNAMGQ